jgi:ABC-type sulfate/molybdate transport systems ATPase subunit
MTPALAAEGLVIRRGKRAVLHGVDLAVEPGEVVAVLGPNGAGKSTLLAALQGALPPAAGRVRRSGRAAMIMQSPGLANRTALANVLLAMSWWGTPRANRRPRATAALEAMRADHLAKRLVRTLSGGEQRRIHLARALAVNPATLLLDEPFDGLDTETHAALREDTTEAFRASGAAVVVVLHDRADAWAMADRICVLIDGHVHAKGAPQAILDKPPTAQVARLLGYDGALTTRAGDLLTRPNHVRIEPTGEFEATVAKRIKIEDGLLLRLTTNTGAVWCRHHDTDLQPGAAVRFTVVGGVTFDTHSSDGGSRSVVESIGPDR